MQSVCKVYVSHATCQFEFECLDVAQGVINCPASLEFTEIMGKRFCAASIIDLVVATSYIGTPEIIRLPWDHRNSQEFTGIGENWNKLEYIDVREVSHLLRLLEDLRSR